MKTTEEFVGEINQIAPTYEQLVGSGLDQDEAKTFHASCILPKKETPTHVSADSGALSELFAAYDTSAFEVGMVRFVATPQREGDLCIVGRVEVDILVIDLPSGEVQVRDHASPQHVIWRCAVGAPEFMTALVPAARFLGRCLLDETHADNEPEKDRAVAQCTGCAGGREFGQFWGMILGA